MKSNDVWFEVLGWIGGILLLGAFALYSFGLLSGTSVAYAAMNLAGSVGIFIVSFRKRAWQPGVLNVIWALVALYSVYVYLVTPAV